MNVQEFCDLVEDSGVFYVFENGWDPDLVEDRNDPFWDEIHMLYKLYFDFKNYENNINFTNNYEETYE